MYAKRVIAHMESLGYEIYRNPGEINIVYVEGVNLDGIPNKDEGDRFNDLCLLIRFENGDPVIIHRSVCTTEPGYAATIAASALKLGGVARVQLAQYKNCWQMGTHKNSTHPALVQRSPMMVHRDLNKDGKRTKDKVLPAWGINQHGTKPNFLAKLVGMWSQGCLVRLHWKDHLEFIDLVKTDPRYVTNKSFLFTTSILDGSKI